MAYGILVPWPGIEPVPPTVKVQSLNNWPTREVPTDGLIDWLIDLLFDAWFSLRFIMGP